MSYKYLNSDKILEHFHHKLSGIRTGRVNASVLDTILVDVYGSKLTIKELATITMPEPTQLLITPFDKNLIQDIQKAINNSTLGVNPNDDGAGIRLAFPPLTEENKKERLKEVGQILEESKISVRSNRQDLLKTKKKAMENDEISEDELRRFEGELQKEVDTINKELEEISKNKEEDLMRV
ncbi:ribosome recycling factor [Candidatus Gracilibacteria bacterium]|nr:ribosome recycling factor [Thermales bacterium]NJL96990.1 ribosome recycling factor [Candidatus Gracilibacteria bacterium]